MSEDNRKAILPGLLNSCDIPEGNMSVARPKMTVLSKSAAQNRAHPLNIKSGQRGKSTAPVARPNKEEGSRIDDQAKISDGCSGLPPRRKNP